MRGSDRTWWVSLWPPRPGCSAPMLNYSLAFGGSFILEALRHHAATADAPYAVWPIALAGGPSPTLRTLSFLPIGIELGGSLHLCGQTCCWVRSWASYGWVSCHLLGTATNFPWVTRRVRRMEHFSRFALSSPPTYPALALGGVERREPRSYGSSCWGGLLLLGSATLAIAYGSH